MTKTSFWRTVGGLRGVGAFVGLLWCATGNASGQGVDLSVGDGQIHELERGSYIFDRLMLGDGATVALKGSSRIYVRNLVATGEEARIVYMKGLEASEEEKYLELLVENGEGMRGRLTIDGSGASGSSGRHGGRGGNGRRSDGDVRIRMVERGPFDIKVPEPYLHCTVHHGGRGEDGRSGEGGEDALDLFVGILNLDHRAHVELIANGGAGGRGGNGGWGGLGGRPDDGCDGGNGGQGGSGGGGGDGGDGGDIDVRLLYRDGVSEEQLAELSALLDRNIHAEPGEGGAAGGGGLAGGGGGVRPGNWPIGDEGHGGGPGSSGRDGSRGGDGTLYKGVHPQREWDEAHPEFERWRSVVNSFFRALGM